MPAPRFIRIGAPSGDGPPPADGPLPAPQAAVAAAPSPQANILPPEVFGVWSDDAPPAPARTEGSANGHGAGGRVPAGSGPAAPARPAAAPPHGPVPPAPARGGRVSHEDERLNTMRHSGRPVEAVCFDALRVTGRLVAFDQYALILEVGGQEIVLFKHGVIMVRYAE